jgi:hypothetical protein
MASKLVTERGFRRASVLVFGDQPAPYARDGPLRFDWYRSILSMFRGSWITRRRKVRRAQFVAIRSKPPQQDLRHIGSSRASST